MHPNTDMAKLVRNDMANFTERALFIPFACRKTFDKDFNKNQGTPCAMIVWKKNPTRDDKRAITTLVPLFLQGTDETCNFVVEKIFSFLNDQDVGKAASVSHYWKKITGQYWYWQSITRQLLNPRTEEIPTFYYRNLVVFDKEFVSKLKTAAAQYQYTQKHGEHVKKALLNVHEVAFTCLSQNEGILRIRMDISDDSSKGLPEIKYHQISKEVFEQFLKVNGNDHQKWHEILNQLTQEIITDFHSNQPTCVWSGEAVKALENNKEKMALWLKEKGIKQHFLLSSLETFLSCGHEKDENFRKQLGTSRCFVFNCPINTNLNELVQEIMQKLQEEEAMRRKREEHENLIKGIGSLSLDQSINHPPIGDLQ